MDIKVVQTGSAGNAYLLADNGDSVLIEAGAPWQSIQKAMDFNTSSIRFCLISHEHGDHARYVKNVVGRGIYTYGPVGVSGHHRYVPIYDGGYELNPVQGWRVTYFAVPHDVPCFGYLIARKNYRVLYITDALYSPFRFKNLTHIMLGINYSRQTLSSDIHPVHRKHIVTSHMSLETAKGLLAANDLSSVREIWLLHLSDTSSDAEFFKSEIQKLTGKVVFIG